MPAIQPCDDAEVVERIPQRLKVWDPLPETITLAGPCRKGEMMQWGLGTLPPGAQRVVRYSYQVSRGATDGAPLRTEAEVTADGVSTVQDAHMIIVIE
jgi:hypothetical protein